MTKNVESGRVNARVKSIHIHDNWNPHEGFDGDLALLKIDSVKIGKFIRPVCIASPIISSNIQGTVVGWGKYDDSAKTSDVPRKIELPILSKHVCSKRNNALVNLMTDSMFCAGKQGAEVCVGDSGSGFYVEHDERFYLRGIVSSSSKNVCGRSKSQVALYTDVLKNLSFLN